MGSSGINAVHGGSQTEITADMKSCVFALAFIAVVFSAPMVPEDDFDYDVAYETEFVQTESASDLKNVVAELKKVAPEHLQGHVAHMAEHAELLQDGKAKAYANTSKFNINPPGIGACKSKGENSDSYGPASWKPTKANC